MSYSDADRRVYAYGPTTYTADVAESFRGPRGKQGKLIAIHSHATTTFAGATTQPVVQIGKSGTLTAYASWALGLQAAGTSQSSDDSAQTSNPITNAILPADTNIIVGLIAATGGGAAGVGRIEIVVDWDW